MGCDVHDPSCQCQWGVPAIIVIWITCAALGIWCLAGQSSDFSSGPGIAAVVGCSVFMIFLCAYLIRYREFFKDSVIDVFTCRWVRYCSCSCKCSCKCISGPCSRCCSACYKETMIYDMVQYGHRRRPGHGDDPDRVICEIVESPPVSAPTVSVPPPSEESHQPVIPPQPPAPTSEPKPKKGRAKDKPKGRPKDKPPCEPTVSSQPPSQPTAMPGGPPDAPPPAIPQMPPGVAEAVQAAVQAAVAAALQQQQQQHQTGT